ELSMIAYWTIKFRLMGVDGVANIPIWGQRPQTVDVMIDPQRMRAYDVTLETVSDALDFGLLPYNASSKTRIDGMLDTPNQRLVIHQPSPVLTPEQLANVAIERKKHEGKNGVERR